MTGFVDDDVLSVSAVVRVPSASGVTNDVRDGVASATFVRVRTLDSTEEKNRVRLLQQNKYSRFVVLMLTLEGRPKRTGCWATGRVAAL